MSVGTQVALVPHISEMTYSLAAKGTYVFKVDPYVNKLIAKVAVEAQFGVTVTGVRVQVRKGKVKKSARRRSQPIDGQRASQKLMFVSLKEGDKIAVFEGIE